MSLTTRTIPQLFNGVSRQPAILRSMDQTESELNSWAAASSGVGKRPPTEVVAKLTSSAAEDGFIHIINRDAIERYVVVINGAEIKVIGFDGVARTVNTPGGVAYITAGDDQKDDLKAVTVADYTFILNRSKNALMKVVGADTVAPPEYVRDPVRTPEYDGGGNVTMPGRPGGYAPNTSYV